MSKARVIAPLVLPECGEIWERSDLSLYTRERAYIHRRGVLTRTDEWVFFAHTADSPIATHMLPIADFLRFFFRVSPSLASMISPVSVAVCAVH